MLNHEKDRIVKSVNPNTGFRLELFAVTVVFEPAPVHLAGFAFNGLAETMWRGSIIFGNRSAPKTTTAKSLNAMNSG